MKLAPEVGPQAEPREQRDAEGQAGSKLEGKAFAFLLRPSRGPEPSAPSFQTHGGDWGRGVVRAPVLPARLLEPPPRLCTCWLPSEERPEVTPFPPSSFLWVPAP